MNRFWKWKNETLSDGQEARSLEIYGEIASESWFDDDVTPDMFRSELMAALPGAKVTAINP